MYWKVATFDPRQEVWDYVNSGSEEYLSEMLLEMLTRKANGQEVRIEWSEGTI
jgi:hypothetical protein